MTKADRGFWKYLYMPILNTIDKDIYEVDTYKCDFYTAQGNSKELFVANKKFKLHKKWAYDICTASHRNIRNTVLSIILDRKNNFLPRFYLFYYILKNVNSHKNPQSGYHTRKRLTISRSTNRNIQLISRGQEAGGPKIRSWYIGQAVSVLGTTAFKRNCRSSGRFLGKLHRDYNACRCRSVSSFRLCSRCSKLI